jgi:sporulation protein YlmC with PRC-barrel domain
MKHHLIVTTAIATAMMSFPAFAQSSGTDETQTSAQTQTDQDSPPVMALTEWDYDQIYENGWSLSELIEADVVGEDGEDIGDVENVLLDESGQILSVVAEVGGFLDIGDTHVAVPFDEVEIGTSLDKITVPVDQDNVEDYSIFGEFGYFTAPEADTTQVVNSDLVTGPRIWKATDLLDDYAVLTGGIGYGYVDDMIFVEGGKLHAVVVDPAIGYGPGPYAYPYYGYTYGWTPGATYYDLGYGEQDVAVIETFDPEQMNGNGAMATGSIEDGQSSMDSGSGQMDSEMEATDSDMDEEESADQ